MRASQGMANYRQSFRPVGGGIRKEKGIVLAVAFAAVQIALCFGCARSDNRTVLGLEVKHASSPDEALVARMLRINTYATDPFLYAVHIVAPGEPMTLSNRVYLADYGSPRAPQARVNCLPLSGQAITPCVLI